MRALWEDLAYAATAKAHFRISEIGLPQNSNRRDVFLYVQAANTSAPSVYAYKTRAEAWTAATAKAAGTNYIASSTAINPALTQVVLTDNGANDPDMTGLTLNLTMSGSVATYHGVWIYTCCPDVLICEDVVQMLKEHMGDGKALELLDETLGISVGDPAPWGGIAVKPMPCIGVFSEPWTQIGGSGQSAIHVQYPIIVKCMVVHMTDPSEGGVVEGAWKQCRWIHGSAESILTDEERTLYFNRTDDRDSFLTLFREASDGPAPEEENPIAMTALINLVAEFHAVWRDDAFPRA